jgi:nicotinamide-nucleotide amidase
MTIPADAELGSRARTVAASLEARGLRLVTVESCTGGFVAKLLTDISGSSRWFEGGYVTYSNAAKQRDVGVQPQTLLRHGAVSEATVREMAEGALARTGADLAVALSGVAGPTGGTVRNPVGSVWIGVAARQRDEVSTTALHQLFEGDRDAIRRQAVDAALAALLARFPASAED